MLNLLKTPRNTTFSQSHTESLCWNSTLSRPVAPPSELEPEKVACVPIPSLAGSKGGHCG
jgi:hypothetical protein